MQFENMILKTMSYEIHYEELPLPKAFNFFLRKSNFSVSPIMELKKFICRKCEKTFSSSFEVYEHENIHTGESPFMCRYCDKIFITTSDYVHHVFENHLEEKSATISGLIKSESNSKLKQFCDKNISHNVGGSLDEDSVYSTQNKELKYFFAENKLSVEKQNREIENGITDNKPLGIMNMGKSKQTKIYSCSQCNIRFKSVKKYSQHNKLHIFTCKNCNNRYPSSEKLSKHICFLSSDGEPFQCSCSLTFTQAAQFKLHVGSKPYSCCKCCMQFNRITNLVRHIRTHTKQKPYICMQCGRGFSQSTNLRNHVSVHLGVKAIQCNQCDFSCKTLGGLIKHKKKHKDGFMNHSSHVDKRKTSTETISCPICNKQFPFKRNVGMHMKIHRRKESLCQECGKVFSSKSKLTTHYKACHGVPSVCQTCGKTFASSVLLAAHEKIHVTGKNFSCTKCYKMFSIKNYLVQHMKTHCEGKQYSCSKCGKLFKVAVSLKYHNKICASLTIL